MQRKLELNPDVQPDKAIYHRRRPSTFKEALFQKADSVLPFPAVRHQLTDWVGRATGQVPSAPAASALLRETIYLRFRTLGLGLGLLFLWQCLNTTLVPEDTRANNGDNVEWEPQRAIWSLTMVTLMLAQITDNYFRDHAAVTIAHQEHQKQIADNADAFSVLSLMDNEWSYLKHRFVITVFSGIPYVEQLTLPLLAIADGQQLLRACLGGQWCTDQREAWINTHWAAVLRYGLAFRSIFELSDRVLVSLIPGADIGLVRCALYSLLHTMALSIALGDQITQAPGRALNVWALPEQLIFNLPILLMQHLGSLFKYLYSKLPLSMGDADDWTVYVEPIVDRINRLLIDWQRVPPQWMLQGLQQIDTSALKIFLQAHASVFKADLNKHVLSFLNNYEVVIGNYIKDFPGSSWVVTSSQKVGLKFVKGEGMRQLLNNLQQCLDELEKKSVDRLSQYQQREATCSVNVPMDCFVIKDYSPKQTETVTKIQRQPVGDRMYAGQLGLFNANLSRLNRSQSTIGEKNKHQDDADSWLEKLDPR